MSDIDKLLPPTPLPFCYMTNESMSRLKRGGNSKGAVPVHKLGSSQATRPLYTFDQLVEYAKASARRARRRTA